MILFGSKARSDFVEESDWDILILVKEKLTLAERKRLWRRIYYAMHSHFPGSSFDIIIKSEDTFEMKKDIANTISNKAYTEGIKL
ncbi:nucleotidyltransferase domain-containing protein [Dictyoglomus thermophilum]